VPRIRSKVKVTLCQCERSPSGFTVPYHFSISITGCFAFGIYTTCGT